MNLRRLFQSILVLSVLACTGIFLVQPIFAATGPAIDQNAFASFAANAGFAAGPSVTVIIARLIRTVISFLGVIAVVIVVYGGFMYMTAGGNDERVKKAKNTIKNGLIGLVIVLMSFTIAQFIVSRLVGATGEADIIAFCKKNPTDPTCLKTPPFPPPKPAFTLNPPTSLIQCAAGIRNLKVAFVFSKAVKDAQGITITQNNVAVPGAFSFSGQKVSFVPTGKCDAPNETLSCFPPNATFHVEVDSTKVKSASGTALTCNIKNGVNPCSFDFTTGAKVDTKPPQEVSFVDPKDGGKAILGLSKALQVQAIDDSGVSSVEFFAIDGAEAIDASANPLSTTLANGLTTTVFNGSWLPVGYATNASYPVWATGTDCAGNTKTTSKISLMLRAPNCDNDVQNANAPFGETGSCKPGEACDCGGDAKNANYCGLCNPSPCTTNAQCGSGFCIAGKCQDVAVIQSVSPDNGAVDNLITITGSGFGTTPGSVDFLGTEKNGTNKVSNAYSCGFKCVGGTNNGKGCQPAANTCPQGQCLVDLKWSDKEIVVQVPASAIDGPLKVNVPAAGAVLAQSDRTDDSVGPFMSKFDVNAVKRPGLCSLTPNASEVNKPLVLNGLSFGSLQGTGTIYLSSFETKSSAWTNTQLTATIPGVTSGPYDAQVFTGDYFCLNASGVKVDPAVTCFSNEECTKVDPSYTCGASWCSESLKYCSAATTCGQTSTVKVCAIDADCDVTNDEFCNANSKLCVKTDGSCVDVRVGSNTMKFVATNIPSAAKATIATIDTGWKACDAGGKLCSKDADCGGVAGSCKSQPTWGPAGQYVTIYGSGFGTAKGYVKFTNKTSSESVNGAVDFPKACGDSFWHNDSVVVKVPFKLGVDNKPTTTPITSGTYDVVVVPQAGIDHASSAKSFEVISGKPTPGICSLSKSAGPVGTTIDILGENFGAAKGTATFNTGLSAVFGNWTDITVGFVSIPVGAKSGPLSVTDGALIQSNSVNFTIGNCKQTPSLCTDGQTCCGDGSCSLKNEKCPADGPKTSHFAYKVSTSPIPVAPTVVVNCTDPKLPFPSPSPSLLWSLQENICVSSAVTASFTVPMDQATLNATNIKIQKCPPAKEVNGTCAVADWQDVGGAFQLASVFAFQWSPTTVFDTNTLYQVTIKGASAPGGGVKSKVNGLIPGASLAQDFSWQFKTSASNTPCGVGGVNVSPQAFTAKNLGVSVEYLAQLSSNKDKCIVLACTGHSIGWSSSQWAAPFLPNDTITLDTAVDVCSASVNPRYNTPTNIPAEISATVKSVANKPTNKGLLTVALTNPKPSDYFPNCSSACGNAMPWISFNVPMNDGILKMPGAIRIYQCQNSICDQNEESIWDHIEKVSYDDKSYKATVVSKMTQQNPKGIPLTPNTWYRVVVAGWVKSSVLAPLSDSGSNYGSDENKFFPGAFSWRFKTKDSSISCLVDRIGLSPKSATLKYVGERQEYSAIAYGSPDDCSVTGQALQASGWNGWKAIDLQPDKVPPASYATGADYSKITAFMLNNGSISLASTLPKICGGNCLYTGNPIKAGQAVCGNSVTEFGESCDDGNANGKDGCSSICLKEGTAAPTCGNTVVDANEQCDDGKTVNGDGCSATCLYEGALSIKSVCGDNVVDKNPTKGGETCDGGNAIDGDGCSSNCLFEGSVVAYSNARCGDGAVGIGETCDDGNTKDKDGCSSVCLNEGTNTGTDPTKAMCGNGKKDTYEDADCDLVGVKQIALGCSKYCLKLGSSPNYATPSFCGNGGALEAGEQCEADALAPKIVGPYGVAEVSTGASVEVEQDTAKATYGYAISTVQVNVPGAKAPGVAELKLLCSCSEDAQCGTKPGAPSNSLGCGASKCCFERPKIVSSAPGNNATDVCRNTAVSFTFNETMDEKSFGSVDTDGDGKISAAETDPNLQLELVKMNMKDSNNDKKITEADSGTAVTAANCPYYTQQVGLGHAKNVFVYVWNWVKDLFGRDALANATTQCFVPTTYEQDPGTHQVYLRYKERLLPLAQYKLTVKTKDGTKKGIVSKNQVSICLGDNGTTCQIVSQTNTFTTGDDICLLDVVQTTDSGISPAPPSHLSKSPGYYSKKDEKHDFVAKPFSYRKNTGLYEEITSLEDVYAWTWVWGTPVKDTATKGEILGIVAESKVSAAQFKALGKNGSGDVIATASITKDIVSTPTRCKNDKTKVCQTGVLTFCKINKQKACTSNGDCAGSGDSCDLPCTTGVGDACTERPPADISGHVSEVAFLCENPWPGFDQAPTYSVPFVENGANTNFSLFYCRDIGKPEEKKMLPDLVLPPTDATPDQKVINTNVLKELVFRVAKTKDSIGVRVLANPTYLSPMAWFKAQGFTGTPKPTKLDGYEAVQTGTTIYASAANRAQGVNPPSDKIYSNIYVISFNADAGKDAQQIFELVLQNFRLNANDTGPTGVSHVGLCKKDAAYFPPTGPFISCSSDGDCLNQCKPDGKCSITDTVCDPKLGNAGCVADPSVFCDADKQKLIRDTKRLMDVTEMVATFEKFGNTNGRCAVTKSQKCVVNQNVPIDPNNLTKGNKNPACPGTETCNPSYPTIQAGTFIPSMSNSIWPSWNSTLGNAVGAALPSDPLNQFWGQCKNVGAGYDSATCWNSSQGKFLCPDGSHVYAYQNKGGEDYILSTELEYNAVAWSDKIDQSAADHATVQASYRTGKQPSLAGLPANSGFIQSPLYCNASVFGSSTICGDGVKAPTILDSDGNIKQQGEECEKGEVKSIACALNAGFINVTCSSDCKSFQNEKAATDAGATCKPFTCGNKVVDKAVGEICDEGALNGTYGHCGKDCKVASDFACGDGYLAGNETCDCGTPTNFNDVQKDTKSWSKANCTVANGVYLASGANCTADCKAPGPMCGDKAVNDVLEKCDGNTETYAGAFCEDGLTKCTKNEECPGVMVNGALVKTCGTFTALTAQPTNACPKSKICTKSDAGKIGSICVQNSDCGVSGVCSAELYDLTRARTCENLVTPASNSCNWITNAAGGGWGACAGGPQQCGNGKKEGTEECDDGNSSDNDSCTNACKLNICGDNKVNVGIESCDSGGENGTVCNAAYGASCNFCNKFCQYKTQSGPYCGDGVINGNEFCDGNAIPYQCFKADSAKCAGGTNAAGKASNGKVCDQSNPCGGDAKCGDQSNSQVAGTCSKQDEGKVGGQLGFECSISHTYCRPKGTCWDGTNPDVANTCTSSADCPNNGSCVNDSGCYGGDGNCVAAPKAFAGCDTGYTCRLVGSCNGGDANGENGKLCTTGGLGWEYYPDNNKNYCDHTYTNGVDTGSGTCQIPVCGPNCGSTCPTAFQKVSLQVQGNVESQPASSINLYGLENKEGKTPNKASIFLPACRVGSGITADLSSTATLQGDSKVSVSLIAATHIDANGKYVLPQTQTSAVELGNGIKLSLPTKFICHNVPFAVPLTATFTATGATPTVTFKNVEFTYCPLK